MDTSGQTEQQEDTGGRAEGGDRLPAEVRVVFGRAANAVHPVTSDGLTIGRDDVCALRIEDTRISRQHLRIERGATGWSLLDLGSRNGGYVDGVAFRSNARVALDDGALVRVGDTLICFRSARAVDDAREQLAAFPGVSPNAARVRRRIATLAAGAGHVLVLGETGTGKERVARAVAGADGTRVFITQNCAELTRELARSELFGHVRGAFSGATQSKPGLVDFAGDGALFLDEIGELTMEVQGELLRFLEDGTYRPVGGTEIKHSAARVIAATNVDIDRAVAENRFRRDLAARLRATNAPLELPPLRERREDIPGWTALFLAEVAPATFATWTAGALECLMLYPWLDNLRELRSVVRTLATDGGTAAFTTEALPERVRTHRTRLRDSSAPPLSGPPLAPTIDPTREEIEAVLCDTHGRMRTAAQRLGIDRRKLYRLCERFGIALEEHRRNHVKEED